MSYYGNQKERFLRKPKYGLRKFHKFGLASAMIGATMGATALTAHADVTTEVPDPGQQVASATNSYDSSATEADLSDIELASYAPQASSSTETSNVSSDSVDSSSIVASTNPESSASETAGTGYQAFNVTDLATYSADPATLTESKATVDKNTQIENQVKQYGVDYKTNKIIDLADAGIVGDGKTDVTDQIQNALNQIKQAGGGIMHVPAGQYMIRVTNDKTEAEATQPWDTVDGLMIPSNTTLVFDKGAKFTAIKNASWNYVMLNLKHVSNVNILGAELEGDRKTHDTRYTKTWRNRPNYAGETGWGIVTEGASNVNIKGNYIHDFWGDGIDLYGDDVDANNNNVNIVYNTISSNRRQGISVENGTNIVISYNLIENTDGTAPRAGIDVEPSDFKHIDMRTVSNIEISNNYLKANNGPGVMTYALNSSAEGFTDGASNVNHIKIFNNTFDGNNTNAQNFNDKQGYNWQQNMAGQLALLGTYDGEVYNNKLINPNPKGLTLQETGGNSALQIDKNTYPTAGMYVGYNDTAKVHDNYLQGQDIFFTGYQSPYYHYHNATGKIKDNYAHDVIINGTVTNTNPAFENAFKGPNKKDTEISTADLAKMGVAEDAVGKDALKLNLTSVDSGSSNNQQSSSNTSQQPTTNPDTGGQAKPATDPASQYTRTIHIVYGTNTTETKYDIVQHAKQVNGKWVFEEAKVPVITPQYILKKSNELTYDASKDAKNAVVKPADATGNSTIVVNYSTLRYVPLTVHFVAKDGPKAGQKVADDAVVDMVYANPVNDQFPSTALVWLNDTYYDSSDEVFHSISGPDVLSYYYVGYSDGQGTTHGFKKVSGTFGSTDDWFDHTLTTFDPTLPNTFKRTQVAPPSVDGYHTEFNDSDYSSTGYSDGAKSALTWSVPFWSLDSNYWSFQNPSGKARDEYAGDTTHTVYYYQNKDTDKQLKITYQFVDVSTGQQVGSQVISGYPNNYVTVKDGIKLPNGYALVDNADEALIKPGVIVKLNDKDITQQIKVKQTVQTAQVTYQFVDDDMDGKTVGSPVVVSGQVGKQADVKLSVPSNYQLASGQTLPSSVTIPKGGQNVQIHLKHQLEDRSNEASAKTSSTRTIKLVDSTTNQVLKTIDQTINFKRSQQYDKVTNKLIPGSWQAVEQSFPSVDLTKAVLNYKPANSKDNIIPAIAAKDVNPASDQTVLIQMVKSTASTKWQLLDADGGNRVVDSGEVTGTIGSDVKLNISVPTNYQLKSGESIPSSVKIAENNPTLTYYVTHKTAPATENLTKTVQRYVTFNEPGNSFNMAQTAEFKRTGTQDLVTGDVKYTKWTPAKQTLSKVVPPEVKGYTYTANGSLDAVEVTPNSGNLSIVVDYQIQKEHTTFQFIDDDGNGNVVSGGQIDGANGETVKLHLTVPDNYELNGSTLPTSYTLGDNNPVLTIHIKHKVESITDPSELSRTKTRTVHINLPDGSQQTKVQSVKFTRTGTVDLVTKKHNYSGWSPASQTFEAISVPIIDGYQATNVPGKVTIGPDDADIVATVDYQKVVKEVQTMIQFEDVETGKVVGSQTISGKDGQAYPLSNLKLPDNYEIYGDQPSLVLGQSGQVVKVRQIKRDNHNGDQPLTETLTRTINLHAVDGSVKTIVQKAEFKRSSSVDTLTGDTVYGPWSPTSGKWARYEVPQIAGQSSSVLEVQEWTVDPNKSHNEIVDVHYSIDQQEAMITYYDDTDNQKVLRRDNLIGDSDATVNYDYDKIVDNFRRAGYDVVSSDVPTTIKLDHDKTKNQIYAVHLKHHIDTLTDGNSDGISDLKRTLTRTITVNLPGQEAKIVPQVAVISRNVNVDRVTNLKTFGDWSTSQWDEYVAPVVPGYVASVKRIDAKKVDGSTKNMQVDIDYAPAEQSVTYQLVDDDETGKIVVSKTLTGQTGTIISVDVEKPDGYDLVTGQQLLNEYQMPAVPETITVHLKHHHSASVATKKITRTINLHYVDRVVPVVQEVTLTAPVDLDVVTGQKTIGDYDTGIWNAYEVPELTGYQASIKEVPEVDVDSNTQDQVIDVAFTKLSDTDASTDDSTDESADDETNSVETDDGEKNESGINSDSNTDVSTDDLTDESADDETNSVETDDGEENESGTNSVSDTDVSTDDSNSESISNDSKDNDGSANLKNENVVDNHFDDVSNEGTFESGKQTSNDSLTNTIINKGQTSVINDKTDTAFASDLNKSEQSGVGITSLENKETDLKVSSPNENDSKKDVFSKVDLLSSQKQGAPNFSDENLVRVGYTAKSVTDDRSDDETALPQTGNDDPRVMQLIGLAMLGLLPVGMLVKKEE